jgi:hypothetical protein
MMPRVVTSVLKLEANNASAIGLSVADDKVMLAYKTAPAIIQDKATKSTPISEYLFGDFRGQIITTPEQDIWKDVTTLPPEVASIPKPVIQFDISMTEITHITNNQTNTTNITNNQTNTTINNNTTVNPVQPVPATPTQYDKLLCAHTTGFGNLGPGLKWTYNTVDLNHLYGNPAKNYFIEVVLTPYQIWQSGYWSDSAIFDSSADKEPDGRINTVGMTTSQLYAVVRRGIDSTGFPLGSGQLAVSNSLIEYVYDSYSAVVNRPPDFSGLCYWCIYGSLFDLPEQKVRETINKAAIQNNELGGGLDPLTTAVITPKYILDQNLNAALVGNKPIQATGDVLNYESVKTPDGRDVLTARTPETMIQSFYETYLGRKAEEGGLRFWMGQYNDWVKQYGDTADGRAKAAQLLEAGFKASPERQTLGGDNFKSEYYY